MGRWKSDLVIRYSGSRGSTGITRDTARGLEECGYLTSTCTKLTVPDIDMDSLASLDSHTQDIETNKQNYKLSRSMPTTYVQNSTSGVLHKFTTGNSKTVCGLQYLGWPHEIHSSLPSQGKFVSLCARCCRHEKNLARTVEDSSDEDSD